MANQSANIARNYQYKIRVDEFSVTDGITIYQGQFVAFTNGKLVHATSAFSGGIVGLALHESDNSDSAGTTCLVLVDGVVGDFSICSGLSITDCGFLGVDVGIIDSQTLAAKSVTSTTVPGTVTSTDATNSKVEIRLKTIFTG